MLTKSPGHFRELFGLFLLFMSLLIGLSLWSYDIADPTFNRSVSSSYTIQNYAGTFGAYLSGVLTDTFGLASYIFVLFFLAIGLILVTKWVIIPWYSMIGYFILSAFILCASEAFIISLNDIQGGGFLGAWLYAKTHDFFNPVGGAIVWFFLMLIGLQLCFNISWVTYFSKILSGFFRGTKSVVNKVPHKLPALPKSSSNKKFEEAKTIDVEVKEKKSVNSSKHNDERDPLGFNKNKIDEEDFVKKNSSDTLSLSKEKQDPEKKRGFWNSVFNSDDENIDKNDVSQEQELQEKSLPSTELLSLIETDSDIPSMESLNEKGEKLIQGLLDFSVSGQLVEILPGPVVTMFEIRPERGVKAKRFEVLSKDIAMAIKAIAVRVQAPIPGTDTVGIEVPNDKRQTVSFREVIESEAFTNSKSLLTLGIGKDIFGKPSVGKLDEMPHLLVAGATGAGKSVCLNSIILSILYKAKPHEVKLLLIDPKRVELAMYEDLPHLVHPVVTEMDLAKNALNWAIEEMEQRYQLFLSHKVRNFTEYNKIVSQKNQDLAKTDELEDTEYLEDSSDHAVQDVQEKLIPIPYLVIIIDELADLMMQKGKEVEANIVRLAQLARAAGIHLIIATQRPSVDVVTGLIKANFPSRIAFQVTSGTDSRTILDAVGAEALLGKGDMLFKPRSGALQRMHGAFVTDDEVNAVVDFWKKECKTEYLIDFSVYANNNVESNNFDGDHEFDSMYDTVLERVVEMEEISISMLQRQFKLGFGRAGRIMDQLEREGIVGPPLGSKPRKVIR